MPTQVKGRFILPTAIKDDDLIERARCYIDKHYVLWLSQKKRQDDFRCHYQENLRKAFDNYGSTITDRILFEHAPILELLICSTRVIGRLKALLGCFPSGITQFK